MNPRELELLSPARNLEYGKAAILHGADAVYIGASQFGARQAAGNSLDDIAELVRFAHFFRAKVYVTINTLLFDHDLSQTEELIKDLYTIGVDAIIVQDMGILEMDIPPVALHASTQTHNDSLQKVQFLEQVSFQRVILARELSLKQISEISQNTKVELEAFVHGALCVCYSGQCYMSRHITGKSGNRGECSQPCRSFYDLYSENSLVLKDVHLLSLKDFNASEQLFALCEAGITSFKIEGRLKDIHYLKNVTAHYRNLLDSIIDGNPEKYKRASAGKTRILFEPDIYKTFNRSYSTYFLEGRKPEMASFYTQKSLGEPMGMVKEIQRNSFTLDSGKKVSAGDGFCFFSSEKKLDGFQVNRVEGDRIFPNTEDLQLKEGMSIFRNNNVAFEKLLRGQTSERKIAVSFRLSETSNGFCLTVKDEEGFETEVSLETEKQLAQKQGQDTIQKQLGKLGDTFFELAELTICLEQDYFIPISVLNDLRRRTLQKLTDIRIQSVKSVAVAHKNENAPYFREKLDYTGNILNEKAEAFYRKHGVKEIEKGFELQNEHKGKVLMKTKYCLLFEMGQCLKNPKTEEKFRRPLVIKNNQRTFALKFDCENCQMQVLATD